MKVKTRKSNKFTPIILKFISLLRVLRLIQSDRNGAAKSDDIYMAIMQLGEPNASLLDITSVNKELPFAR